MKRFGKTLRWAQTSYILWRVYSKYVVYYLEFWSERRHRTCLEGCSIARVLVLTWRSWSIDWWIQPFSWDYKRELGIWWSQKRLEARKNCIRINSKYLSGLYTILIYKCKRAIYRNRSFFTRNVDIISDVGDGNSNTNLIIV